MKSADRSSCSICEIKQRTCSLNVGCEFDVWEKIAPHCNGSDKHYEYMSSKNHWYFYDGEKVISELKQIKD